jgi:hypothetical protein
MSELMNKVEETADLMGANLICGGKIETYYKKKGRYDVVLYGDCFVYFYGPAYLSN